MWSLGVGWDLEGGTFWVHREVNALTQLQMSARTLERNASLVRMTSIRTSTACCASSMSADDVWHGTHKLIGDKTVMSRRVGLQDGHVQQHLVCFMRQEKVMYDTAVFDFYSNGRRRREGGSDFNHDSTGPHMTWSAALHFDKRGPPKGFVFDMELTCYTVLYLT